jgi:hypothetical protein
MRNIFHLLTVSAILCAALLAGCGETRTSGFFVGEPTGTYRPRPADSTSAGEEIGVAQTDTLINCAFDRALDAPFGTGHGYEVYDGALHVRNGNFEEPVVLFSTAGLQRDGLVEVQFDIVDAPPHCVVGLVLRAESREDFLLLGVNSRGQYTVQKMRNGLWHSVMGMDAFQESRLLPYSLPGVLVSARVHGSYIDLRVNGQLIQVVRTHLPPLGQVGVFVDGYADVAVDRFTVVPEGSR